MKTMLKLVALTLVVMMTLCSVALADSTTYEQNTGSSGADVKATYTAQTDIDVVYYVTISWGDMMFNVTENLDNYKWNPSTHSYGSGEDCYTWKTTDDNDYARFSVKNGSNTDIDVTVAYTIDAAFDPAKITGRLDMTTAQASTFVEDEDASGYVDSENTTSYVYTTSSNKTASITINMLRALCGSTNDASFEGRLTISGSPLGSDGKSLVGTDTQIGTITISIAQAENAQITASDYTSR